MLIRCERCQALYSLQDGLAQEGARVTCGRCHLEFAAPRRQIESEAGADPSQERGSQPGERVHMPAPRTTPAEVALLGPKLPAPVAIGDVQPAPALSTPGSVRKLVPPPALPTSAAIETSPDDKPPKGPTPAAVERLQRSDELARLLRPRRPGDAPSAQATRPRWPRAPLWLAAIAVLLAGGFAVQRLLLDGLPREAKLKAERARERLMLDDAQSLEQAAVLYTDAARLAPRSAELEADRATALLLLSGARKDLSQLHVPDDVARAARADGERLLREGLALAKAALDEAPEDAAANRAMALYCVLAQSPDRADAYLSQAERGQRADVLTSYVRAALSRERGAEGALSQLLLVQQAEPRLLRAHYDAAALALGRQELGSARKALEALLQQNPAHERARAVLASLPVLQ